MPSSPAGADRPLAVLVVFGTRPEAIKLAPVIAALRRRPDRFGVRVCSTGQHREMLDQAREPFDLVPDVDLGLMRIAQAFAGASHEPFSPRDAGTPGAAEPAAAFA